MRILAVVLSGLLVFELMPPPALAQAEPAKLNLVIVEGEGAINNIRQRTAREPIVQVEDENHKPIAGAAVVFLLPNQGASGTFTGGSRTLTTTTDAQGRAVARGFHPNNVKGQLNMRVTASYQGKVANATITQTNVATAVAGAAAAGISAKLIAVLAIAGAAAAGGAIAATRGGGSSTPTTTATISPGTGTVGAPH
ncbi:MAG TPA: hypothetical protein VJN43_21250 [Bryobacteraceae bacterium]|nr:hypothetical protein [Bryobacteraceae bacterium]